MKDLISKVWNADCVEGMQQFEDDFFDWAIVDIEYCLGASKPTKKPNKVKQKNGNEIFFKNEIYERFVALCLLCLFANYIRHNSTKPLLCDVLIIYTGLSDLKKLTNKLL